MIKPEKIKQKKSTLIDHLGELRSRIIKSIILILIITCSAFTFIKSLLPTLIKPVGKLIFIAPGEAFAVNIKVAFFCGLFLSSPFILYQIWQFVSAGLNKQERKYIRIFGPLSFLFFVAGTSFCFFIIVPISIKFLLGFATDIMTPMITASKYISFVGTLTLAFGIVFELPLVALFLTKVGLITPKLLIQKRKYTIVIIFIMSALLTPPDVITQCLMAIPLLVLYEIGIIFSKMVYKDRSGNIL
ncbi:MAG: twin-arginine translocase subunit TatC [Candidatus Zapsychrus exili]|nr:twin-arginine translocase subunit TatC [Candidatus Zapsychrus exili]